MKNYQDISTKKTPGGAAKALAKALVKDGYTDAHAVTPKDSDSYGWGETWHVVSEMAPFEWALMVSMGENMYTAEFEMAWNADPTYKVDGDNDWYTEPYNSYILGFSY